MMIFVINICPQLADNIRAALVNTTFMEVISNLTVPRGADPITTFVEARTPGQHVVRLRGEGIVSFESFPVEWDDGTTYNIIIPQVPLDQIYDVALRDPPPVTLWDKVVVPNLPSYRTVRMIRV